MRPVKYKKRQFTTSYAQNREDIIIDAFFGGKRTGTYVDVGAADPVIDSVTKFFYLKGWRGVNIEPNPEYAKLLEIDRPDDSIIAKGAGSKSSTEKLRVYRHAEGLSTYNADIKTGHDSVYDEFKKEYYDIETPIETLADILDDIGGLDHIDFLKVDVEGSEYEVLEGNNWEKYKPELICIEADHVNKDWHKILKKNQYEQFFYDGLNEYYAPKGSRKAKDFSFSKSILMQYPVITPFRSHADGVDVSNAFFEQPKIKASPRRAGIKTELTWGLMALNDTMYRGFSQVIMKLKRKKVRNKIVRNLAQGGDGVIVRISYVTPKIMAVRVLFRTYIFTFKVLKKLRKIL